LLRAYESFCFAQSSHTCAKVKSEYKMARKMHPVRGVWAKFAQLKPLVAVHAGGSAVGFESLIS